MNGKFCRCVCLVVFVLGGFCLAVVAVPSLANEVSTRINLSHYHEVSTQTTRVPPNASVNTVRDITPSVTSRSGGGLTQTMPGSITINSVKTSPPAGQTLSGPFLTNLNVGKTALQAAMFGCMRHVLCRAGSVAIPIGVDLALDHFGAEVDSSGELVIPGTPVSAGADDFAAPVNGCFRIRQWVNTTCLESAAAICSYYASHTSGYVSGSPGPGPTCVRVRENGNTNPNTIIELFSGPLSCPSGSESTDFGCILPSGLQGDPVTDDLLQQIADGYEPQPADWQFLADSIPMGHPDVSVEVMDIPRLTGADSPNFIQNADGTSTGTYSEYDFSVRNNNSSQPIIDVEETTVVTEYDQTGAVTGTSTSTSSQVGAGGGAPVNLEVPTDCAFFPTACRFFDWVMQPFADQPPEVPAVVELDVEGREVEIGASTGVCPAPYVIALDWVPAVELSFEPICDLGESVRSLVIALALFLAAMLVVRSV